MRSAIRRRRGDFGTRVLAVAGAVAVVDAAAIVFVIVRFLRSGHPGDGLIAVVIALVVVSLIAAFATVVGALLHLSSVDQAARSDADPASAATRAMARPED